MDKFQAAFEVLCFLSAIDGEMHQREINVINDFLGAQYGKITFNPRSVVQSISNLSGDGLVEEFTNAAVVFKNNSTARDRNVLLDFGLSLIGADGKITMGERDLFFVLGRIWNIDMLQYLRSKGLN